LEPGDATSAPASLPEEIYLRSTTATYNRRYWFIVRAGRIYFKSNAEVTGIRQPWAPLRTPNCFDGQVRGISADDDEMIAIGPERGRVRAVDMSASGSTVFVINRFGDMFTRLYDFDISGPDSFFLDYSYEDQRGVQDPAIQLPPEPWREQPKIPGRITGAISIEKVGLGSIHRTLRVEGVHGGVTGFWEKDITEPDIGDWRFVPTGAPLEGEPLSNSPRDT